MFTVRKLLESKGEPVIYTVPANATVLEALKAMEKANTGAILVTDGDKIVGIFTERDYARQGEVKGRHAESTPVKDVMTRQIVMVTPETSLQECAVIMRKFRVRHLPVTENDKVVGMVSIRGLAEALLQEQHDMIEKLEDFIQGTGYGH